jgi:tetratricopeptide (TPR) repeat protein
VHGLLGGLLSSAGRYGEALAHLEAAYAVNPGDVAIVNNLAWLLATSPEATQRDGPRAVRLAEWACRTTSHKSPPLLDSLAAAYAQAGQFDRAIRTTEQAIEIVRRNRPPRKLSIRRVVSGRPAPITSARPNERTGGARALEPVNNAYFAH